MKETILDEAARVTSTDRNQAYGHPLDNHGNTAEYWRLWLKRKYGLEVPLVAEDVCWMNVLQKVSREANAVRRDNKTDVAGYVRNVEMIEDERARRDTEANPNGELVAFLPAATQWRCARGCESIVAHYGQACTACAAEAA